MRSFLLFVVLALFGTLVQAQAVSPTCLPGVPSQTYKASSFSTGASKNGAWVWWDCTEIATLTKTRFSYVGTIPELSRVGPRVQTIMNALDPLKSLQTAGSRYTILPLEDASLALVVADMWADQAKR